MKKKLLTALSVCAFAIGAAAGSGLAIASTYHPTDAGGAIPLKDLTGAAITAGSTTPYSPENTCGGCHDTQVITQGYHFQQGKGFSNSDIRVSDTYNTAKPWLLSDGMFGKW